MKFSIRYADKIVGALVILALAILVIVIFMLGRNQRWFVRDLQYKTYFASASGLGMNMPVQYKGFTIGNVKKISLTDDDNVEVIFIIFKEQKERVKTGSMVEIQSSPIGLGNSFIFHPGNGPDLLDEGELIPEINSPQARFLVEAGLAQAVENTDRINSIIYQVNTLLEAINRSIVGTDQNDPALAQILERINYSVGVISNIAQTVNTRIYPILYNLDSVTGKMSDPSGSVMSFLDSGGNVYSDLSSSMDSLTGILNNLEKTSDIMPSNFPALMSDLNAALKSMQDVLIAISNNPLLRRGIPEQKETTPGGSNPRNLDF
jgi:phospholipid/cholesterol/gamma-HCH transport system substrate-binding protein